MNRFTHFEFATHDCEKTAAFYRAVFGWKVEKWEGPVDYWMVTTGDEKTLGINGGLMEAGGDFQRHGQYRRGPRHRRHHRQSQGQRRHDHLRKVARPRRRSVSLFQG